MDSGRGDMASDNTDRKEAELGRSAVGESLSASSSVQYTAGDSKQATQELLRLGHLTAELKPQLYRNCVAKQSEINRILEPLDLQLKIDDVRGIAYLSVVRSLNHSGGIATETADDQEDLWTHPLIRRQRLTLEQSLLLAILRQHYVVHEQEAGLGAANARVSLDELLPQLRLYLGDSGSDSRDLKRLRNLLENLRSHGVVSEPDGHGNVVIKPLITHLANPETLQALLQQFTRMSRPDQAATGQDENTASGNDP